MRHLPRRSTEQSAGHAPFFFAGSFVAASCFSLVAGIDVGEVNGDGGRFGGMAPQSGSYLAPHASTCLNPPGVAGAG